MVFYSGVVADVEIAVSSGIESLERPELLVRRVIIPQLHADMWDNISAATAFADRVAST